jgi:hypothetical protein
MTVETPYGAGSANGDGMAFGDEDQPDRGATKAVARHVGVALMADAFQPMGAVGCSG